ncbi:hypothetical protein KEJ47_01630 [Candidatus Bathyarchaeota archaeon]|nr:hypothetical protein [Candidatus Bathyarchaeota archaeon]
MSLFIPTITMALASENKYIYRTATPEEVQPFFPTIIDLGPVKGVRVVKPDFTYEYVYDNRTLDQDEGYQYGYYYPYAISVRINTLSPSGYTLTVSIISGGQTKWSGELGEGESSPTITCNGAQTYVRIVNQNSVQIHYTSTITLIYN